MRRWRHLCSGERVTQPRLEHEADCARNRNRDGEGLSSKRELAAREILIEEESVPDRDEKIGPPTDRGRDNERTERERVRNRDTEIQRPRPRDKDRNRAAIND